MRAGFLLSVCSAALPLAPAQELDRNATANGAAGALVTVHGEVRNAATGQPVPRALVRIEGDADTGALTDGEGRFEIPGLAAGPQAFQVTKPGFRDRPYAAGGAVADEMIGPAHNVLVAEGMPPLVFLLAPTSAVRGPIALSTGDPAQGIELNLLKRRVEDGRAVWQPAGVTKTDSEGAYRFAGLADGVYVIYTTPTLESEPASTLVGEGGSVARAGYASIFYPDARDLTGAARIQLAGGEQAQANFTLTLEPFHTVTAEALLPGGALYGSGNPAVAGMNLTAQVMDAQGHVLPYNAMYDPGTKTVQATLPDGVYSLVVIVTVSRFTASLAGNNSGTAAVDAGPFAGAAEFTLAGHAISNLRVPLSAPRGGPIQTTVTRSATQTSTAQGGAIMVTVSQAGGWIDGGMMSAFASGAAPGPLETAYTLPGQYWVHTHISQRGLCEASFTAGGANLAREPLVVGIAGSTAPMELTLRDDCARLTLSLPQNLAGMAAGEEPSYTVYVVPGFDTTTDVTPLTLRASTGGTITLEDLTPGSYSVYTFSGPARLEYRNPAVLAALPNPGQTVTLSAGTTSSLVLEAPGH
jgi:hypothetical protein